MGIASLLHNLNPKNDLSRFVDDCSFVKFNPGPEVKKSVIRGGTIGALVGATVPTLYSLFTGNDVSDWTPLFSMATGAVFGAATDFTQFSLRYIVKEGEALSRIHYESEVTREAAGMPSVVRVETGPEGTTYKY